MTMFDDLEEQLRWTPEQVKELIKFYRQFRPRKSEDNLDLEEFENEFGGDYED